MNRNAAIAVAGLALLIAAPFTQAPYGLYILCSWLIYSVATMGLNLTLGYAGQISLAQGAFMGIGAYVTALLALNGVSWFVAAPVAVVLCFFIGLLLGYPALRVQHHFLAFVTLAFNMLVWLVLRNEDWLTGGNFGLVGIPRPSLLGLEMMRPLNFYFFTLAIFVVMALILYGVIRSPWGRAFQALRENPIRADSVGVDIRRMTLLAFAIGSAFGGMAGALLAPLVQYIEPNTFALLVSLKLLLMVIVGGSGYFYGPLLGAGLVVVAPEYLRFTEGYYLIIYGTLVVVLMIFCPSGLMGLGERIVGLFRTRRTERGDLSKGAQL